MVTDVNARHPPATDHVAPITAFSSFRIDLEEVASAFPGARPGKGTGFVGRIVAGVVIVRIPWMHLTMHRRVSV